MSAVATEPLAKQSGETAPNWDFLSELDTVTAIQAAARIVAAKYKDRTVNMLAEFDDLVQDGYTLVAIKPRLRGLEPALLKFRLVQELNGLVKYGARKASVTTYLSALENE